LLSGRKNSRLQGILVHALALFLALHALCDGFTHQPVRRTLTRLGQALESALELRIELDRCGRGG